MMLSLFVLAVIQGITEFLPVSSDGHLALASMVMSGQAASLQLVLLLHVGTLLATLVVFRRDVFTMLSSLFRFLMRKHTEVDREPLSDIVRVIVASVPTAMVGLLLHDVVEPWANIRWVVALFLLVTAGLCLSTRFLPAGGEAKGPRIWAMALVGLLQGLAVLPGLSRSASTIVSLRALKVSEARAFRLSFLMSLPAVAGAVLLEGLKTSFSSVSAAEVLAVAVSFAVGLGALKLLERVMVRGKFWVFALYLVPLALLVLSLGS